MTKLLCRCGLRNPSAIIGNNMLDISQNWVDLANPLFSDPHWSVKDAALAHDGQAWILAASFFNEERSTVAVLRNEHGLHWGDPIAHWHGPEDGWRGYCSPNIIKNDDAWFIVFNSWGDTSTDQYNRLFYVRTTDWSTFTDPLPLAHELLAGTPVIDGALAYSNGRWFLGCNKTNVHPRSMHFASAAGLAGPWEWVVDSRPELFAHGMNIESGFLHENGQLICADDTWYLVSTDYRPHQPWLYRLTGDPAEPRNWSRWHDG